MSGERYGLYSEKAKRANMEKAIIETLNQILTNLKG
jgi:hypothetical protein